MSRKRIFPVRKLHGTGHRLDNLSRYSGSRERRRLRWFLAPTVIMPPHGGADGPETAPTEAFEATFANDLGPGGRKQKY